MRLTEDLYLVGSTQFGLPATDSFTDLQCNIYLIDCGDSLVMIDAGCEKWVDQVVGYIKSEKLDINRLKLILLTHEHIDHTGACFEWSRRLGVKIACSESVKDAIEKNILSTCDFLMQRKFNYFKPDIVLKDEEILRVGKYSIKVIYSPGHSQGSTCYFMEADKKNIMFTGDVSLDPGTGFKGTGWSGDINFDPIVYKSSLEKIYKYLPDVVLPGHSLVRLEKGYVLIGNSLSVLVQKINGDNPIVYLL